MNTLGPFELGRVHQGDALALLPSIPSESVDALITDPPYSSGGFTRGDRNADPVAKYQQSTVELGRESFSGDNRDGRSWCYWMALWLSECHRVLKAGAYALTFSDWRQLPLATDALQAGGFVWRGVVAWDKGESARAPHTGYFRHQAEYVVWGTKGPLEPCGHGGPFPGVIRCQVDRADKHHLTGKPVSLMRELVKPVRPGGIVLDPFAGSFSTGIGALHEGRQALGFELSAYYVAVSNERIAGEARGLRFADTKAGQQSLLPPAGPA